MKQEKPMAIHLYDYTGCSIPDSLQGGGIRTCASGYG